MKLGLWRKDNNEQAVWLSRNLREASFEALVWIHGRQPGAGVVLHRLRTSLKFKLEIGHEMPPSPSLREPPLGNLFPLKLFAFHIHDKSFCPVRSIDSGRR